MELLVVVLMLVALVGIAVPTFVGQQERAQRSAIQSELRTAAIALETFRATTGSYGVEALGSSEYGFVTSRDVATVFTIGEEGQTFCVRAWYDPLEPGEVRGDVSALADTQAEWAMTHEGLVSLPGPDGDRTCP